jgi:hypothetical protein
MSPSLSNAVEVKWRRAPAFRSPEEVMVSSLDY